MSVSPGLHVGHKAASIGAGASRRLGRASLPGMQSAPAIGAYQASQLDAAPADDRQATRGGGDLMSDPTLVTITVTVTDFNPDAKPFPSATFGYSDIPSDIVVANVNGKWTINPWTGLETWLQLTPAPDSPWTKGSLTPNPSVPWVTYDGWTVKVDGTRMGKGAATQFRLTVVQDKVSYVDDPTIIMVDPPP
jgi:hypothetical protein